MLKRSDTTHPSESACSTFSSDEEMTTHPSLVTTDSEVMGFTKQDSHTIMNNDNCVTFTYFVKIKAKAKEYNYF